MKRLFDIVASGLGLLALSPIFLILAIWIKCDSKGPVFYRQVRVGKDNKDFRIYKFRSMRTGSDKGSLVTIGGHDPRITRSGYFIRKFKLDELPQLINVFVGDMSLVGPRPEVRHYVDYWTPEQMHVLDVSPGITDPASIKFRNENELMEQAKDPERFYIDVIMQQKIALYLEYVKNQSFWYDIALIFKTFKVIVTERQYNMNTKRNIPFSPPDMTEAEANEVREAILSGWITTGPRTKQLEKLLAEYIGVEKCVCLNSQTACAEMALRLLGIGAGDEVIIPAYTYTASASVVSHIGARVVLVDVQSDKLEMDYDKMADAITERTKAIIPVDLCGIPCNYNRIYEVVESKKGLFRPSNDIQAKLGRVAVCCDAAHALGASWHGKMVGSIADFSSFSFHAVKNFTTAEGGALSWSLPFGNEKVERQQEYLGSKLPVVENETWNEFLYRLAQLLSLHGQNKDAFAKTKLGAWEYDIIGPWYKCNMTDVAAAMGLIQFERYPKLLARRREIIERFDNALAELPVKVLKHYTDMYEGSGHLYLVRLLGKSRSEVNNVIEEMAKRGVACNVHYKPLPMMTAYRAMGYDIKDFPNAFAQFENEITLPLNTKMTDEDVEYVIDNFIDVINRL